jgi:hypothetical protein
MKSAIIQSLQLADVNRPTIDFVIEELFKNAGDSMIQVRKACLGTLERLRARAHNTNITYLRARNILPLFYFFLQDAAPELRTVAIQSIHSFGPQGELLLIEGLTKDKNTVIRQECARGLSMYGSHTFRALIFGLRDVEESVRTATANAIRKAFQPTDVINEFREKHHQKPAIICAIKEILNLNYWYGKETRSFLEEILNYFQNEINVNRSQDTTTNLTTLNGTMTDGMQDASLGIDMNPTRKNVMRVEDGMGVTDPLRRTFNDFQTFEKNNLSDNKSQKSNK